MDLRKLNRSELDELISNAEMRKRELVEERISSVRDKVLNLLKSEGVSFEQAFGARGARGKSKSVVKPKYRNPQNPSQTWAGRGKRPRWMTEAIAGGKKDKDFLIT